MSFPRFADVGFRDYSEKYARTYQINSILFRINADVNVNTGWCETVFYSLSTGFYYTSLLFSDSGDEHTIV